MRTKFMNSWMNYYSLNNNKITFQQNYQTFPTLVSISLPSPHWHSTIFLVALHSNSTHYILTIIYRIDILLFLSLSLHPQPLSIASIFHSRKPQKHSHRCNPLFISIVTNLHTLLISGSIVWFLFFFTFLMGDGRLYIYIYIT